MGGAGATASGSVVTIGSAGTYSLSGSLTNGQVIVNTKDNAVVRLILNGVNIHSSVNAPIYVKKAEKVVLVLADNSTNVLTDAATYTYDVPADEEPSAAVFSKSDLTIYGNVSLDITGNFGDGIVSKDGLVSGLPELFARLLGDLLAVCVLVRLIYYRIYRKTDLFLTFFTFNLIIFLITYLLNQVQMSIGAAFGLFAVFSMLRYRTEGLSAKDMTYLFVVIAMGLISVVSNGSWVQVALLNGLILLVVYLLEGNWLIRREFSKTIIYDRIGLILPERRLELLADLRNRTGLPIHRYTGRLKLNKETEVWYYRPYHRFYGGLSYDHKLEKT